MVFGVWREILNSNAESSAMMVVFAQFFMIKIFDSNVSKNKETNKNPSSCHSINAHNFCSDAFILMAQNDSSLKNEYSLFSNC